MKDMIVRGFLNIIDRFGGPMTLRVIMQPLMASIFGLRAGLKDAREGKPPYFWDLVTGRSPRLKILRGGWRSIGRVFILAIILDVIYQLKVLHWIYPLELLAVAILLAVVPYLLVRGPVNRIAQRLHRLKQPAPDPALNPPGGSPD